MLPLRDYLPSLQLILFKRLLPALKHVQLVLLPAIRVILFEKLVVLPLLSAAPTAVELQPGRPFHLHSLPLDGGRLRRLVLLVRYFLHAL